MEKPKIREAIAVEGRYDGHAVRGAVDACVVELGGYAIWKRGAQLQLLRQLAETCGLILLTDSDRAGMTIRSGLRGRLPAQGVKMAYIPAVPGKERRKKKPGKDGLLGVEAMDAETIREALRRAGATFVTADGAAEGSAPPSGRMLDRAQLYEMGLMGKADSAGKRAAFAEKLGLPPGLSVTALIEAVNAMGGLPEEDPSCSGGETMV